MASTTITKFAHLQIPLKDVVKGTDNFSHDLIIEHADFGPIYKGLLWRSGKVIAVRRFDRKHGERDVEFWTEISVLSGLNHKNIVSIIGFCDEKDEKIIVTPYVPNGSLGHRLTGPNFPWMHRLKISVDVARALSYLHNGEGRGESVIHGNINSSAILLDENFNAKLSDFRFSIKQSVNRMDRVIFSEPIGKVGYKDPEIERTKGVSQKSDIYSLGVIMFELLYRRKAFIPNDDYSLLAPLAIHHYESEMLKDVCFDLWNNEISPQSFEKYSKVAYSCLQEERAHRPNIKYVVAELENALKLELHPENSRTWNNENNNHGQDMINNDKTYTPSGVPQIRLKEILSATNNFADENLIKKGEFGKDYKGQLLGSGQSVDIYVRRFDGIYEQSDIEFETEISMLSSFKHRNIISLVGFCDEGGENIIIYEHALHGSLDQHLGGPNLRWFQRLNICLGVARGLSHIHYDGIHCDINSSKILLDKDWEPKISGFELSTKYPQSWKHRLLSSHSFDNTNMTPKYDVYCFGVLLFEVLYGVKPVKAQHHGIINPKLQEQMDRQLLAFFTKIIDNCLNEHPVQRPTMDQVVKELEDAFELQWKHENLEHSTAAHKDEDTSSSLLKIERLKIPLNNIRAATNGFDEAHFVASGGFGSVYKGELDVSHIQNSSSIEGEQPKITTKTTVAIKCIKNRLDEVS